MAPSTAFYDLYKKIREFKFDQEQRLVTIDHKKVEKIISRLQDVYKMVDATDFADLDDDKLNPIFKAMKSHSNHLDRLNSETPAHFEDRVFNEYKQTFTDCASEMHNLLIPIYPASLLRRIKLHELVKLLDDGKSISNVINDVVGQSQNFSSTMTSTVNEGKKLLDDMRKMTASHGVISQSNKFSRTIRMHWVLGGVWLSIAIGFGIVLICTAYKFLEDLKPFGNSSVQAISKSTPANAAPVSTKPEDKKPDDAKQALDKDQTKTIDYARVIQYGLTKLVILGMFSYAVVVSVRNFHAHMHNATVNSHRANAILTYESFVDPAATPEFKDKILTYVASCVFSPQDTGFTGGSADTSTKNIIEVFGKKSE